MKIFLNLGDVHKRPLRFSEDLSFAAHVSLSGPFVPRPCSEGVRHGRIRWSSKLSMIHGGGWLCLLLGDIPIVLLAHIPSFIEIYSLFQDCFHVTCEL